MKESKIQWTNHTWNPWHGCKKVSEGCKYCYMFRDKARFHQDGSVVVRSKKPTFNKPFKLDKDSLVFTCSQSDFFIKEADEWRPEAWEIILNTHHLTYQILTKRPERVLLNLPGDWVNGYENVWLGTTVENMETAWERIDWLVHTPARVRFLSVEPMLEEIDLMITHPLFAERIHWVIVGGESGNDNGKYRYRECRIEWIEKVVQHCKVAGVPVFVKQLGTHISKQLGLSDRHGGNIDEFPESLRVREMPLVYTQ